MQQTETKVHIENLHLRTYIDFNESERQNKRDVIINAWINYPTTKTGQTDDVDNMLNYWTIYKRVIEHIKKNRFREHQNPQTSFTTSCRFQISHSFC